MTYTCETLSKQSRVIHHTRHTRPSASANTAATTTRCRRGVHSQSRHSALVEVRASRRFRPVIRRITPATPVGQTCPTGRRTTHAPRNPLTWRDSTKMSTAQRDTTETVAPVNSEWRQSGLWLPASHGRGRFVFRARLLVATITGAICRQPRALQRPPR